MTSSIYLYLSLFCIIIGKHLSSGQSESTSSENDFSPYPVIFDYSNSNINDNSILSTSNASHNLRKVNKENIKNYLSSKIEHSGQQSQLKHQQQQSEEKQQQQQPLLVEHLIPYYQIVRAKSNLPNALGLQDNDGMTSSIMLQLRPRRFSRPQIRSQSFLRFGRMNKRPLDNNKDDTAFLRFGRNNKQEIAMSFV